MTKVDFPYGKELPALQSSDLECLKAQIQVERIPKMTLRWKILNVYITYDKYDSLDLLKNCPIKKLG